MKKEISAFKMNKLKLLVPSVLLILGIQCNSQSIEDYQFKLDSLNTQKQLMQSEIIKIDSLVILTKKKINEIMISEIEGEVFMFHKDGMFYNERFDEVKNAKTGTKVVYIEEKNTFFWEVLFEADTFLVKPRFITAFKDIEAKRIAKRISDSLEIANAKEMIFNSDASLFETERSWDAIRKSKKGSKLYFVKMVDGHGPSECMIIYNDTTYFTYKHCIDTPEEYENRLLGIENAKKANEAYRGNLIKKFGAENAKRILEKKIWIGMTKEMLKLSWGAPEDINRTVTAYSSNEQWVYGSQYVYIEDGIVTAWQD